MRPEQPSDPDIRFLDMARGKIAYTDVGRGATVVALHGCPGSVMDWRWLGVGLEAAFRLIRVDLPGFGKTPLAAGPAADAGGRAKWVLGFLDALDVDDFVVLGHSAGGFIALELAARHPERARGLGLIAAPGIRPHGPVRDHPWAGRFSGLLRVPLVRGYFTRILRKGFEQAGFPVGLSNDSVRQSMHVVAKMDFGRQAENVAALEVPTMVTWAEDDSFIDLDISRELSAVCPSGPRLAFAEGGHYIQKTQAVEIAEALVNWISGLDQPSLS